MRIKYYILLELYKMFLKFLNLKEKSNICIIS